MKLQEIFDQLTYGELSQLSIGGGEQGEIRKADWPKVLAHVNLGLSTLYKRFLLREGRITLQLQPNVSQYHLRKDYAQSNARSLQPVKYLLDTDTPFQEDIHKVEQVFTDTGIELSLNDPQNTYSLHMLTHRLIQVPLIIVNQEAGLPDELKTETLELIYRADHPRITVDYGALIPDRYEVELPYSHLEALLYFVASRMHNPVGMTNEFHTGNNYAAKFEMACQAIEAQDIRIERQAGNNRLERKGWV